MAWKFLNGRPYPKSSGGRSSYWTALTRNTDIVLSSGYYSISEVTFAGFATGARSFLNRNNITKIRQAGDITKIRLYLYNTANITELFFDVWRKDGTTWDRIAHLDVIAGISDGINTLTLSAPISVQEGDFTGISGDIDGAGTNLGMVAQTNGSYLLNAYVVAVDAPWDIYTSFGYYVPIQTYMQAPFIVGIGHSQMAGHDGNYSNIEVSTTVNLSYQILYNLKALDSKYIYQNMGIGATTTSQFLARFDDDVVDLKPKICLMIVGVTDIINGTISKTTFLSNVTAMIDKCIAANIIPVVIGILPWSNGDTGEMQTADEWNTDLVTLVASYSTAIYVNCAETIGEFRAGGDAGNLWDIKAAYNGDGIHLNEAGYTAVAGCVNTAIRAVWK